MCRGRVARGVMAGLWLAGAQHGGIGDVEASSGFRVVVAPDSFKHALPARAAAEAIADGVRSVRPGAEIVLMPVADGGEGTLDVLAPAGLRVHVAHASGPLGEPLMASWGSLGGAAVVELARVAGLGLVGRPCPRTAWRASTRGAGQLVRAALNAGHREIVIAAGGTASSDGGAGMLLELGLVALDDAGRRIERAEDIGRVAHADPSGLDARLASARFTIASDVRAPLLGPEGAARCYGPQKGADAALAERLERRLERWADAIERATGRDARAFPGAGAAGGIAAGMSVLGAPRIVSGLEWVARAIGLPRAIEAAQLVIVGEGALDRQSAQGKAPAAIAAIARGRGVPVAALCGRVELRQAQLAELGVAAAIQLSEPGEELDRALAETASRLRAAAARLAANPPGRIS